MGWLARGVDVCGGDIFVMCGYGECWAFLVCLGMGYGDVWSKTETVCVCRGIQRFKLEDVELVWARLLDAGLMFFSVGRG